MRWQAVMALDALVFWAPSRAAEAVFVRTGELLPLRVVARASASWRRCLAWLLFAPE